jgi:hypothetical protein
MQFIPRWMSLYLTIAFLVLIPAASYYVISHDRPKKILLIVIPGYILMACSCYGMYRVSSKTE